LGARTASYDLTITATVHTTAQSDFGPIDDTFTQTLTTKLGEPTLEFTELTKSQSGSIEETVVVTKKGVRWARACSIAIMLLVMAGCGYVMGMLFRVKPVKPSLMEQEARRVRKKYKDLIVDIDELPGVRAGETVIPLNSLADITTIADGLGKVVLHQAEKEKHTYCVIDGMVRYDYISRLQPPETSLGELTLHKGKG
jgi:hypothetical protein